MDAVATGAFWVVAIQAASTLLTAVVFACLPEGCLVPRESSRGLRAVRNAIGFPLLGAGLLLSLPILPGPGNLLVLLGMLLVDFRAKNRLQDRLLRRLVGPLNRVRALFGRPPIKSTVRFVPMG